MPDRLSAGGDVFDGLIQTRLEIRSRLTHTRKQTITVYIIIQVFLRKNFGKSTCHSIFIER